MSESSPEFEVLSPVQPTALEAIQSAEISQQIATAHKFPRSMTSFKKRATEMATLDVETAESCIYVRPVGRENGKPKYAEGLSVRMAEIIGASYGNLRVGAMIVEQTDRHVIVRGFAHDLESNFASTSEVKEATIKKDKTPYDERMCAVIAKAALAKARRDATFQVVPKALCKPIEQAARALINGNAKSFTDRKAAAIQWAQRLNIDEARIFAALDIKGWDDLTSDHLLTLTGIKTAIRDNDTTIDEAFPPVIQAGKIGSKASDPKPKMTPTEAAAAEKKQAAGKPAETPTPQAADDSGSPFSEPEKPKGPTKDELLKQIMKKAKAMNFGGTVFTERMREAGYLPPTRNLDELDEKMLAQLLDGWDEIEAQLTKKES